MVQKLARLRSKVWRLKEMFYPAVKRIWVILNSPLIITLVSGLLISAIARSYNEQNEAAKDLEARSVQLDAALTELQQRLTYLDSADRSWSTRCNYATASVEEWDTITGIGKYVPTSPSYKGISITVVLAEAQRSSGAWDPGYDASRWFGLFSVRPPQTALFIRTQLPWLRRYVSRRMFASTVGHLPLGRGAAMTDELKRELAIPSLKEAQRENDKAHKELMRVLNEPRSNHPPCT